MVGRTIDFNQIITPDQLGLRISQQYIQWEMLRREKVKQWEELRRYIYATDTRNTTNASLPWKNTTTIPKLCQIRDNLIANYMASLFPKRKWLIWEGANRNDNSKKKKEVITNYMKYVIDQDRFKKEIEKCVYDYVDYGNTIAMPEWVDETQELEDKTKVGYIGPTIRRISPLDIVFNPVGVDFMTTPKVVRSLVSKGEVKELLERVSTDDTRERYEELWNYLKDIRLRTVNFSSFTDKAKNDEFLVDGFHSYFVYLQSGYVELLTFYGDIYDEEKDEYLRNHIVVVADRHKVIWKGPNPSYLGYPNMFHVGWRKRQDNLWAMGPLDNLIGMQYRIDHVENLKADCWDLVAFPTLKIKGYVEDFEWGPFEKIYVQDDGDVSILAPPYQVLVENNNEIETLERRMEEMAGSPKEAMGFRTPGEKTAYEVQRLENAASRIFQAKIRQFEEQFLERLLNSMLELARRTLTSSSIIRVFDDQMKIETFMELTPEDLSGAGIIKPVAARHFAEKAELVQNLNTFFGSPVGIDEGVKMHFSGIKTAEIFEELLEIQDFELVTPYIRLTEQADAQRMVNAHQQNVMMEAQTPAGLSADDTDQDGV